MTTQSRAYRQARSITVEQLLGRPLNRVERRLAPNRLYVCGKMRIPLQTPRVAVVGTRNASEEGLNYARELVKWLCRQRVIIVSGLAKGIDTAAHLEAVRSGGETAAVLGTPLSRVYPPENKGLQSLIMSEHLAVSQFPDGHRTQPRDFILRNMTIALISDIVVVVEADEGGDSESTAWSAIRLGRPLLLTPLSAKLSHKMEKYGAEMHGELENLLEALDKALSG
ncbi:MAG: DNA-processing protein DprA [Candidatus Caldarchaeum sp.]